jgi:class 3 adenylate cyclase/tetratricopeptide (TPR) repeat protein
MLCPYCRTANPAAARFCMGCGRQLVGGVICSNCLTLLPPEARFCTSCGAFVASSQIACPQCGAGLSPGQAFCSTCGAAMPQAGPVAQPGASHPPPSRQLAVAPSAPAGPVAAPRVSISPAEAPVGPVQLSDLYPRLKGFLPDELLEPLGRRPDEKNLLRAGEHLAELLNSVKTYLPRPVIESPQPPGHPRGGIEHGTFLFADVSGFTPLSERLKAEEGGAEKLTTAVNNYFNAMVKVLHDHGGTLLKFGGDAFLGLFPTGSPEELSGSALAAARAAWAMQVAMGQEQLAQVQTKSGPVPLRMKVGISSGPFFAAHIGTEETMAYVTTGHTVNHADLAESHAEPGEVVVAASTLDLVKEHVQAEERDEGFYHLLEVRGEAGGEVAAYAESPPPAGEHLARISYFLGRLEALRPYLAADLLPRLVTTPGQAEITPGYRRVTVMFANYRGLSELIEAIGDEQADQVTNHLNDYFVRMAGIVQSYDGSVGRMDQYSVGDRLILFFGAPKAHEDDPVRAIHTALEMQEAMEDFKALRTGKGIFRFSQRIGINTGWLFDGNVGASELRQEYTLMGDDINMAARLMSKAEWGEILISRETQISQGVTAYFDLTDRGEMKVKGKTILIPTFQVMGRRREAGKVRGLSGVEFRIIGRDGEIERLRGCLENLRRRRGQIVSIMGDSGLGKSTLLNEFKEMALGGEPTDGGITWLEARPYSFSERMTNWLAVQVFRNALSLGPEDDQDEALYRLWERGRALLGNEAANEAIPYLAALMDLELTGEWAQWVKELDAEARQKQTFWAAREFFAAMTREKPLVIALDDLHWTDESSLNLFIDLLSVTDQTPLMLCLVFRPRRDKGCWRIHQEAEANYLHRYTRIEVNPLPVRESEELLTNLLAGAELSAEDRQRVLAKAAGNPFYLEELVRSLRDSEALVRDNGRWQATAKVRSVLDSVPDTLQGAILARIDRLTEDSRQALKMASVIGLQFQYQLLDNISQAEEQLGKWLIRLERDELIREEAREPEPEYSFRDALIQEVAYESMTVQQRQEFHRRVGEALEEMLGEQADQECQRLAYHFKLSNDQAKARYYLEKAGLEAQKEFANDTALEYYNELLALMPESSAAPDELAARFDILAMRQQIYDLRADQDARRSDLEKMMEIAQSLDDDLRLASALNGLADLYRVTGNHAASEEKAREALALGEQAEDKSGLADSLYMLGVLFYERGSYRQAEEYFAKSTAVREELDDPQGKSDDLMYLGMIHLMMGDYGGARERYAQALQISEERRDWKRVSINLTNLSRVAVLMGAYEGAREDYEKSMEWKQRLGDKVGQGFSLHGLGQVFLNMGEFSRAVDAFERSLEIRKKANHRRGVGSSYNGLGLVYLAMQEYDKALDYFVRAYDISKSIGLQAEMVIDLSFMGLAYLGQGNLEEANRCSEEAISLLRERESVEAVQRIYLNHYRILSARQDPAADEFLRKAHQVMMGQAACIGDEEERRRFMEEVKVNREIRAEMEKSATAETGDSPLRGSQL